MNERRFKTAPAEEGESELNLASSNPA